MQIIHSLADWQTARRDIAPTKTLGYLATMGNLHRGHASLCEQSQRENDLTIVSIFVNPTQFNQVEDFENYPRTLDADFELLKQLGVDYCFVPDQAEIYADNYCYRVTETILAGQLEDARAGHFDGALTVLMKCFNLIKPHRTYFGEKDYQQCLLVQGMAKAFFLDLEVIMSPLIRENSGLAYSSRNNRLSPEERILADKFAAIFHQNKSCADISAELTQLGISVEYVEEHEQRRFAAVYIGDVRLIDTYAIPS